MQKRKPSRPSKAQAQSLFTPYQVIVFSLLALTAVLSTTAFSQSAMPKKDDYDRFDGRGRSGKKIDVVEWENNLEIHVYPKGSVAELSLKLDKRNSKKPVMVLGYRFTNNQTQQHIRRAILGIPLSEGFQVFQDTTTDGYDKFIISNNTLQGRVVAYKYRSPKFLYPQGHPMRKDAKNNDRAVASQPEKVDLRRSNAGNNQGVNPGLNQLSPAPLRNRVDENGSVRHFSF